MADEIKVQRATAKGQFTMSEKRLNEALSNLNDIPLSTLERRYNDLESKWNHVQQVHFKYTSTVDPDTAQEDVNKWIDELAERFNAAEIEADRCIEAYKDKLRSSEDSKSAVQSETIVHQQLSQPTDQSHNTNNPIQLERIKLEKFDGDIRNTTNSRSSLNAM